MITKKDCLEQVREVIDGVLSTVDENGNKSKSMPFYPEDWKNSFGLPVNEHSESMVLNMLEGYQRLEYSQRRNVKLKKEGHASIFDLNGGDRNGGQ